METIRETSSWDDNWLKENLDRYPSYISLLQAYNTIFGTHFSLSAIKNHCKIALNLRKQRKTHRHFTDEQLQFLRETYPKYGQRKTLELFNRKFNETRTMSSMKNFGVLHKCQVDPDVRQRNRRESLDSDSSARKTKKSGDTRIECGRLVMKADNGEWKSAARVVYEAVYGPVPDGYVVTVLDGNNANLDPDNLMAIPKRFLGMLSMNQLRSENPIITKTGIVWCELKESYEKIPAHTL